MQAEGRKPTRCARPSPEGTLTSSARGPSPARQLVHRTQDATSLPPAAAEPRAAHAAFQLSSDTPLADAPPIGALARGRGRSLDSELAEPGSRRNVRGRSGRSLRGSAGRPLRACAGWGVLARSPGWFQPEPPPPVSLSARSTPCAGCSHASGDASSDLCCAAGAAGPGMAREAVGSLCIAALLPAAIVISSH